MDKIDQCVCEAFMLLHSACSAVGFRPNVEAEDVDLHGDGLRGYLTLDRCVSISPSKVVTDRGYQIGWAVDRFDEVDGSVTTLLEPYRTIAGMPGNWVQATPLMDATLRAIDEALTNRLAQWQQRCMDEEYAKEVCDGK